MALTLTCGSPLPSTDQAGAGALPLHVVHTRTPKSVAMYSVVLSDWSRRTPLTIASGTPVAPVPLMSDHDDPPSVVCQTWPTPIAPIVTHASKLLVGLTATPEIQALPETCEFRLNAGRLPVAAVQVAPTPVALLLRQTAPK